MALLTPSPIGVLASAAPPVAADGLALQWLGADTALDWAAHGDNRRQWLALYDSCPWRTAFQHPAFFDVWCRHYKQWSPLLVIGRDSAGAVGGIFPLAVRGEQITGIGAHQAEYHGWLSTEEDAAPFLAASLDMIGRTLPGKSLRLRYLPPNVPKEVVEPLLRKRDDRVILTRHPTHELAFDEEAISKTLKKSGNRSKLNRLKRAGSLDIRKLDGEGLAVHLRRIMALYDFRQGAMNGVCPFRDDPKKAAFHLDWIRTAPQLLFATALMIDNELASALLLVTSGSDVNLAISAHAPEHAHNSPMKVHIYQIALALAREGRRAMDLTPGGDPWKQRFSTAVRDVFELVMHRSLADAVRARALETGKSVVRKLIFALRFDKIRLKERLHALRRRGAKTFKALGDAGTHRLIYRLEPQRLGPPHDALQVGVNDLEFLTRHGPGLSGKPLQAFLRQALERIEAGERCYSVTKHGTPLALAWGAKETDVLYEPLLGAGASADALAALVARAMTGAKPDAGITLVVSSRATAVRDALIKLGARQSSSA